MTCASAAGRSDQPLPSITAHSTRLRSRATEASACTRRRLVARGATVRGDLALDHDARRVAGDQKVRAGVETVASAVSRAPVAPVAFRPSLGRSARGRRAPSECRREPPGRPRVPPHTRVGLGASAAVAGRAPSSFEGAQASAGDARGTPPRAPRRGGAARPRRLASNAAWSAAERCSAPGGAGSTLGKMALTVDDAVVAIARSSGAVP